MPNRMGDGIIQCSQEEKGPGLGTGQNFQHNGFEVALKLPERPALRKLHNTEERN